MREVTAQNNGTAVRNAYTYENNRIKTVVHNTTGDSCDVRYTFNYDSLGRKTSVTVSSGSEGAQEQTLSANVYSSDRKGRLEEVCIRCMGNTYLVYRRVVAMKYNRYNVTGIDNRNIAHSLYACLCAYSDAFSLTYCYGQKSPMFSKMAGIKKKLKRFEIHSEQVNEWPGTITWPNTNYTYYLTTYRTGDYESFRILDEVHSLWDWDYPKYPMDLCFYKNGYAWFELSTHERCCFMYIGENGKFPLVSDLESVGLILEYDGQCDESELFKLKTEWYHVS